MASSEHEKRSKNERREAAREKARQLREVQKKKERRTRLILQGGIVLGVIAIIAVAALVIVNTVKPAGPGPANMASDGILIGKGQTAVQTPALDPAASPVPNPTPSASGDVVNIKIWLDFMCPACGAFEQTNGSQITQWLDNGAITLEVRPISFLDGASQGTQYSTRAANAAACVANYQPDSFYRYMQSLFKNQPKESSPGLDDAMLTKLATQATSGKSASSITSCIADKRFTSWVASASDRAFKDPTAGTDVKAVTGTPTITINGSTYSGSITDAAAFSNAVMQAQADAKNK